jgi:hypothetical protein
MLRVTARAHLGTDTANGDKTGGEADIPSAAADVAAYSI